VKILIDTQAFLWWNEDNPKLSRRAARLMANPANELMMSVVSAWEIAIKWRLRKLRLPDAPSIYLPQRLDHYKIGVLPVTLEHVLATEALPSHHRDPFDRLLVAQSTVEKIPIVTVDPRIRQYGIEVVW
jgi:PIN domain nuclease of toxin-antitoxin system